MAAVRRGQAPLAVDLHTTPADHPPISALFLIYFDIKAGYTIGWKRSIAGVELEGVVEYKSLPSGLHTVKEDLIYFVHEDHAGLSAFVNAPADEESRNARMIAVGVMVPLSYGRLGRAWKHADKLKEMASELIIDSTQTKVLEDFWEEHKAEETLAGKERSDSVLDSPTPVRARKTKDHGRSRSASDGTVLIPPEQSLSTYHPAWSLSNLLETFGPLIFPLHRAALLRKRILFTAHAPVEETCNYVYDLSVLSNIPLAVNDLLEPSAPPQKLRPLFSIGVHDIPLLEADLLASRTARGSSSESLGTDENDTGTGWIACTTDSILAMKSTLYDVLITMPPPYSSAAASKVWPKVESPQGVEMKATQRDLRRYRALRWGLSRHASRPPSPATTRRDSNTVEQPQATSSAAARDDPMLDIPDTDRIIEPLSWSALAYSGFMWWASAGEGQRLDADEESENDSSLLSGLSLAPQTPSLNPDHTFTSTTDLTVMAIIAYFHRLTSLIFTTLSDIVDATDSDDERDAVVADDVSVDGEQREPVVYITSGDMVRMGLDVWSSNDHAFVEDVARLYFGRRAHVEGRNVDVCGVRIC